jgi:hypothetical protein
VALAAAAAMSAGMRMRDTALTAATGAALVVNAS